MLKIITGILLIAILVMAIIDSVDRKNSKTKILELKEQIDNLNKYKTAYDMFNEESPPSVQIIDLKRQAEMLKFCFLCPLYRGKVREDKQQELQPKQK